MDDVVEILERMLEEVNKAIAEANKVIAEGVTGRGQPRVQD